MSMFAPLVFVTALSLVVVVLFIKTLREVDEDEKIDALQRSERMRQKRMDRENLARV